MFAYSGSKLESDLNKLTNEAKKSDYEKTIAPFLIKITELEKENLCLKKNIAAMYSASRELINCIEQNYIKVIVCTSEPKVFYGSKPELQRPSYEHIAVPIKQALAESFIREIKDIANKDKELGWLDE